MSLKKIMQWPGPSGRPEQRWIARQSWGVRFAALAVTFGLLESAYSVVASSRPFLANLPVILLGSLLFGAIVARLIPTSR